MTMRRRSLCILLTGLLAVGLTFALTGCGGPIDDDDDDGDFAFFGGSRYGTRNGTHNGSRNGYRNGSRKSAWQPSRSSRPSRVRTSGFKIRRK